MLHNTAEPSSCEQNQRMHKCEIFGRTRFEAGRYGAGKLQDQLDHFADRQREGRSRAEDVYTAVVGIRPNSNLPKCDTAIMPKCDTAIMPRPLVHFLVKNTSMLKAFFGMIALLVLRRFRPYLASYWGLLQRLGRDQPLLVAPILAMIPGYIVYFLSTQWYLIKAHFLQYFFAKVYLKNTDKNFNAIARYIAHHCERCGVPPRTLRAETKKNQLSWFEEWQQ